MTEADFDTLLERFIWRDPDKMSFRELTCAFAIAAHTSARILKELGGRGHQAVRITTPSGREEESPISDGYYTDYDVQPMSEREFEMHLQFVFIDRVEASSIDALVDLLAAAYGAKQRIANALDRRGYLFTSHPDVVDILGVAHPLACRLRTDEDPHVPMAIPERYRIPWP